MKILEFGDGIKSGSNIRSSDLTVKLREIFDLPTFLCSEIGIPHSDNENLQKTVNDWRSQGVSSRHPDLSAFCGIYGGYLRKPAEKDIIVLNGDVLALSLLDDKVYMNEVFLRSGQVEYRPTARTYPRKYFSSLAGEIMRDIPGDVVVVKSADGVRGEGVILVRKNELDATLRQLLEDDSRRQQPKPPIEILNWKKTKSDLFMVEELLSYRPLHHDGKDYNAPMRCVFLFHELEGIAPTFIPLDLYWKLPSKPISSNTTDRDSVISSFKGNPRRVEVNGEDRARTLSALQKLLPNLLHCASTTKREDLLSISAGSNAAEYVARSADRLQVVMANACATSGSYCEALYFSYEFLSRNPSDLTGRYETAMTHMCCEDYDEAIRLFKDLPSLSSSYLRIAMCYRLKGNLQEAKKGIEIAAIMSPGDQKVIAEHVNILNLLVTSK